MANKEFSEQVLSLRLKREGAQAGQVTCSLIWNDWADLDLHCYVKGDGIDSHISYSNKHPMGKAGGWLDVDMNAGGKKSVEPVENIFFKKAPAGKYKFTVKLFGYHSAPKGKYDPRFDDTKRSVPFRVFLRRDGKLSIFDGAIKGTGKEVTACQFVQQAAGGSYVVLPPQVGPSTFKSLCAKYKVTYEQGNGYYAIARKETIHAGKHLMLQDTKKDKFINGSVAVRKALGWQAGLGQLVKKPEDVKPGFRCFVQSTSANRVIPAGTHTLFEVSADEHRKFKATFSSKFLEAPSAKKGASAKDKAKAKAEGKPKAGATAKAKAKAGAKRAASPAAGAPPAKKARGGGGLAGKTICFTGALVVKRSLAAAKATAAGASVLGGVSKALNILVVGPGAGDKLAKAQALGVETWDEGKFKRVVGL